MVGPYVSFLTSNMLTYADEKYTAENTQPTKYTALSPGTEVQLIAGESESNVKGMSKAGNQHGCSLLCFLLE